MRFKIVEDENRDPVVVRMAGLPEFVYALESCKFCSGRGWIGYSHGCSACLGTGKKGDVECSLCEGTGDPTFEGQRYRIMCGCLKLENEFEGDNEKRDH